MEEAVQATSPRSRVVTVTRIGRFRRGDAVTAEGKTDRIIAEVPGVNPQTVRNIRKRFAEEGLEATLRERPRPGARPKLDAKGEAILIALACSDLPEGRECWTMQLPADRPVGLGMVDSISDETVRRVLKKRPQALAGEADMYWAGDGRLRVADGRGLGPVRRTVRSTAAGGLFR